MGSPLSSIPVWIGIITIAAFITVVGINKRNPGDRVKKYIPSIVCLVLAANLTYILLYGWDSMLTNILLIFLVVFLEFVSVIGLFSTVLIAFIIDLRERKKQQKEGLKENEEL